MTPALITSLIDVHQRLHSEDGKHAPAEVGDVDDILALARRTGGS